MRFSFYLTEMAYHQDRAIEKIEDLLPQTILHIFKCLMMQGSKDYNHWLKGIRNLMNQFDRFSNIKKSKRIAYKVFLREYEWYLKSPSLLKLYNEVESDYKLGASEFYNEEKCIKFVQGFLKSLFMALSEDEFDWVVFEKRIKDFK